MPNRIVAHRSSSSPHKAVFDRRKLLLSAGTNQLNGELNQLYDAKFLLTGGLNQRSGGGRKRSGDNEFREAAERVRLADDMVQRR